VQTIEDLKTIKLYTSAGNDRMVQWFKANGFQPRAMAMTDIMTGLSTGMIDGMPSTPLAAMLFQWNRQAPYMLELGLAPIIGANVITTKTWKAIPEADKPKLMAAADAVEKRLRVEVPKMDESSVAMMTKNGLTVTNCSFNGTLNGIQRKTNRTRGGVVQNLSYSNLVMTNVTHPILFDDYYFVKPHPAALHQLHHRRGGRNDLG